MARQFIGYRDRNGKFWEDLGDNVYRADGWRIEQQHSLSEKYGPLKAVYK